MLVGTQQRKKRNSTKVNLLISTTFHAVLVGALIYLAAREGFLGPKAQSIIQVTMEKKKVEEKPKELPKPKEPEPKQEEKKPVQMATITPPKQVTPPPSAIAPPMMAPPPAELPAFDFEGGRAVITETNRIALYKEALRAALQYNWERPPGDNDHSNVAEVEIAVDKKGVISDPVVKKGSGQQKWDNSVLLAIANTKKVNAPPPTNFPPRVVVRFDVQEQTVPGQ